MCGYIQYRNYTAVAHIILLYTAPSLADQGGPRSAELLSELSSDLKELRHEQTGLAEKLQAAQTLSQGLIAAAASLEAEITTDAYVAKVGLDTAFPKPNGF